MGEYKDVPLFDVDEGQRKILLVDGEGNYANQVVCGDNVDVMAEIRPKSVDLIYVDPPFMTGRTYRKTRGEFSDVWNSSEDFRIGSGIPSSLNYKYDYIYELYDTVNYIYDRYGVTTGNYISYMWLRLDMARGLLKDTGSMYVHCDSRVNHLFRLMLDEIFGVRNFRNEIIWRRAYAHNDGKKFGRIHDSLFFYSRTKDYVWHRQHVPGDEKYLKKFRRKDPDGRLWYGDNLTTKGLYGSGYTYTYKGRHSIWRVPYETMVKWDAENRIHFTRTGSISRKYYLDESKGPSVQSLWYDIIPIAPTAKERVDYPTQKPVALMERIIQASSNPGDVVLDPFCGSGTTCVAANNVGRRFIGVDMNADAVRVARERLV